ncbi:DNA-3-methyladenine glycosylase [Catenuloplanes indicus]|uniref:Putative 3-methyladenine DNA glycosylase n=1 Tax=Catenuloplanes indicus TaxID=137267 RepID=A0AAE3W819_9ACTN|nr:DNA-3-methyladenine glycosylase [Catenuloplanes indicus]MDQ0370207.1 DNA-3-methyladenine glycosylase [Catenuloplanes indicus]
MGYAWLAAPASEIAETAAGLLGWEITAGGVRIRLTEVEAYSGLGEDPASHAHRGLTRRNAVMFGPAGHLYAYFVYGVHWCLNVVCGEEGRAAAVLLRAGEVIDGLDAARARRPAARNDADLARGPAKLMTVLGLDGTVNGTSAVDGTGPALITPPSRPAGTEEITAGPRVGVASAHDVPWRFWLSGDATVSTYRRHTRRRP